MGSWNDLGFDGRHQERYEELSDKLFTLLNQRREGCRGSDLRREKLLSARPRKLERALHEGIGFRVLSGNQRPDFWTLSEFRRRHHEALGKLFDQTVQAAAGAGLVKLKHASKLPCLPGSVTGKSFRHQAVELTGLHVGLNLAVPDPGVKLHKPCPELSEVPGREVPDQSHKLLDFAHEGTSVSYHSIAHASVPKGLVVQQIPRRWGQRTAVNLRRPLPSERGPQPIEQIIARTGRRPRELSADAGYCSEANLELVQDYGVEAFIPPEKVKHSEWRAQKAPRGRSPRVLHRRTG